MSLKILFITPSYKPAFGYGGSTIAVCELAEALAVLGHEVTVYTTTANGKEELDVEPGSYANVDGVRVWYAPRITGDHTHVSPALWKKLWQTARRFDVVHLHSWWSVLMLGAAQVCRMRGVKYLLTPHGMLSRYTFDTQHSFVKKLLHSLLGKRLLKDSLLHATAEQEWKDCLRIHPHWKGFILPNLINLPSGVVNKEKKGDAFVIGFLSRIDPKKGLELLFAALKDLPFPFVLKIAGSGEEAYIGSLKRLSEELGIASKIEWCGWMKGEEKFRFLAGIDLFALTSYNENFAIAVTEALAMGTPVLISNGVGVAHYVQQKGLGWICSINSESIRQTLLHIHEDDTKQDWIRRHAPAIIVQDFNKQRLAERYTDAYGQFFLLKGRGLVPATLPQPLSQP